MTELDKKGTSGLLLLQNCIIRCLKCLRIDRLPRLKKLPPALLVLLKSKVRRLRNIPHYILVSVQLIWLKNIFMS